MFTFLRDRNERNGNSYSLLAELWMEVRESRKDRTSKRVGFKAGEVRKNRKNFLKKVVDNRESL